MTISYGSLVLYRNKHLFSTDAAHMRIVYEKQTGLCVCLGVCACVNVLYKITRKNMINQNSWMESLPVATFPGQTINRRIVQAVAVRKVGTYSNGIRHIIMLIV